MSRGWGWASAGLALLACACAPEVDGDEADAADESSDSSDAPDSGSGAESLDSSDAADSTDSSETSTETGGEQVYPERRVGIFYLAWHAYAADAIAQVPAAERHTIEDVIRSPTLQFSDLLAKHGLLDQASGFHWHDEPQLGFYCLYRRRPSDPPLAEPQQVPDCPDIAHTAATHAEQLWSAGVDFVYVDLTNFNTLSTASDVMALRPLEVLLEEWQALRDAGQPTPQIAAWLPAAAHGPDEVGLIERVLDLYADPTYDGLLLHDPASGREVVFVVDNEVFAVDPAALALIEAHDVIAVRLWGNLSAEALASGKAGWMQPCTRDGQFTTLVRPDLACNQGYSTTTPIGTIVSVSASYQLGYASLPYQASGRLEGLTLKQQFATAFAVQPDYLLINAWNEHIAQPQPNPHAAQFGSLARSMGKTDAADLDVGATWLWVDMYGRELGRDLEPTVTEGGAGLALLESCLRVHRSGHTSCTPEDQAGEACCQLGPGMTLIHVLRPAGGMLGDHIPTASEAEREGLLANGFVEVCNLFYAPPGLCGDATTRDGPFSLYAEGGPDRLALQRCWSGSDHFMTTSPDCEGTQVEGTLGWVSTLRTSETPRSLRRCLEAGVHYPWLDAACPGSAVDEGVLGYVR